MKEGLRNAMQVLLEVCDAAMASKRSMRAKR